MLNFEQTYIPLRAVATYWTGNYWCGTDGYSAVDTSSQVASGQKNMMLVLISSLHRWWDSKNDDYRIYCVQTPPMSLCEIQILAIAEFHASTGSTNKLMRFESLHKELSSDFQLHFFRDVETQKFTGTFPGVKYENSINSNYEWFHLFCPLEPYKWSKWPSEKKTDPKKIVPLPNTQHWSEGLWWAKDFRLAPRVVPLMCRWGV